MIVRQGQDLAIMPAIEFEKETIGHILHARKGLRVPINQRSYAWKKEHVEDLFKDLNGAILGSDDEYFLGSIIVVRVNGGIEVYDGQQRLATSMILAAAIRDYFANAGDSVTAHTISSEVLRSMDRKTHELKSHFQLSAEDNEFFVNRILRLPSEKERRSAKPDKKKESHRRISEAATAAQVFINGLVDKLQSQDRGDLLHRWLDFLDKGARVIWVEVADERTAFRVFETMNDRGLKLSAADLIKNYLYSLAGDRKEEVVQKWQSMVALLESLGRQDGDIVDYIRYFWIAGHGHTRSNDLFDKIKGEVTKKGAVVSWASGLEEQANAYTALLTPSHDAWNEYGPEMRKALNTLRFLDVSQIRPVLLAAYGKFSKKELLRLVKTSINWSVRCLITGVPSGTLEGYYSKLAKKIFDGSATNVNEVAKEMLAIIPTDERFRAAVQTVSVADAQLAKYYLRVLQTHADGKPEPQYVPNDSNDVTLEHILPLNPGKGWEHIKPNDALANFNRLGNQALLGNTVNSRIGNAAFKDKRSEFIGSPFSLTQSAGKYDRWSLAEIDRRQGELASLSIQAWPFSTK